MIQMHWKYYLTFTPSFALQIQNHFPIPLEVSVKKDSSYSKVTVIEEKSVYNVPLVLAYRAELYLKPAGFG